MNSRFSKIVGTVLAGVLAMGVVFWWTLRKGAAGSENIVYVCSETGQLVVGPNRPVPAVNPQTGKATLLRGVYCPECHRWYAAPPPDHFAGNPKNLVCWIHKVPMTADGPVP